MADLYPTTTEEPEWPEGTVFTVLDYDLEFNGYLFRRYVGRDLDTAMVLASRWAPDAWIVASRGDRDVSFRPFCEPEARAEMARRVRSGSVLLPA